MYFETGADSLLGILSPGAYYLRGGLSPGHIVLEAYCLLGRIVSGADYLGAHCLGAHCLGAHCLGAPCPPTKTMTHFFMVTLYTALAEVTRYLSGTEGQKKYVGKKSQISW